MEQCIWLTTLVTVPFAMELGSACPPILPRIFFPQDALYEMELKKCIEQIKSFYPDLDVDPLVNGPIRQKDECDGDDISLRPSLHYQNNSQRFKVPYTVYTQQFSAIYQCRLRQVKGHLEEKSRLLWPECIFFDTIQTLSTKNDLAVICGILYKEMKLKPSVLKEYMKDLELESSNDGFLSDDDHLYLEDDVIRIALCESKDRLRDLPPKKLVTGLVIACKGLLTLSGIFEVVDWTLPGVLSPAPLQPRVPHCNHYVAFVSDLRIGSSHTHYELLLKLRSFLTGALSPSKSTHQLTRSIVRLVILGTTMSDEADPSPGYNTSLTRASKVNVTTPIHTIEEADKYLYSIASSLHVDLIPGPYDPTNYSLPQNPLHQAFFPKSHHLATFQSVTNPYDFSLHSTRYLSLPYQSLKDLRSFAQLDSDLEAIQLCAEAQHLCPTAPETLACYPFTDSDPFCFPDAMTREPPHVIFCSSPKTFDFRYYSSTVKKWAKHRSSANDQLVLCVPSFGETSTLVLVENTTLDVQICKF